MTKAELLTSVSEKVENLSKKQASEIVDAVFEALSEAICTGDRFSYPGFGTFTVKERAERDGRNPRTNEPIKIKATKTVGFKAAPKLKDTLNGEIKKEVKAVAKECKEKECKAAAKKAAPKKACKTKK